jgi:hypothetical protein
VALDTGPVLDLMLATTDPNVLKICRSMQNEEWEVLQVRSSTILVENITS